MPCAPTRPRRPPCAGRRAAEVALARAAASQSGRAAAGFDRLAGRLTDPDRALMRQAARAFAQLA